MAVAVAVVVGLVALAVVFGRVDALRDPAALRAWLLGFGPAAPVAFVCLQALQVVVAPVPGQVLGLASGYLFGAVLGTAYSLLGAALGTWVALRLAARFGRPFVERVFDPELVARFDAVAAERGTTAMVVVFLVPGLPDDVICFVAGVTDLDPRRLVAASLVGRLPGYLLANLAGASVAAGRGTDAALILAVLVLAGAVGLYHRDRLLTWLGRGRRL